MYEKPAEAATGTITANTSSKLSFTSPKQRVTICNRSGQVAYFKVSGTGVSSSDFEFALDDKATATIDDEVPSISFVSVYVNATSGILVTGRTR